jgi:hypothetical protein
MFIKLSYQRGFQQLQKIKNKIKMNILVNQALATMAKYMLERNFSPSEQET